MIVWVHWKCRREGLAKVLGYKMTAYSIETGLGHLEWSLLSSAMLCMPLGLSACVSYSFPPMRNKTKLGLDCYITSNVGMPVNIGRHQ